MKNAKYLLIGLAAVACAVILGRAYTYKYRAQDTILVTGLGETEQAVTVYGIRPDL